MDDQGADSLSQQKQVVKILATGLIMGVLGFAAFVFVSTDGIAGPPDGQFLSAITAGFAVVCWILSMIVPRIISNGALKQKSGRELSDREYLGIYQTQLVIRLALLEGAAFANLVALMTEENQWTLLVVGALVVLIILSFPTNGKIDNWIRTRKELQQFEKSY